MEIPIKEINERLERSEKTPIESEDTWYRTNRFVDWLFDTVPYGWRVYYRYGELRRCCISTYQRIRYGVSDAECWSLDCTLTKFILPRLKHFKKINVNSHPANITSEQWNEILDEIIWTFEYMNDEERFNPFPRIKDDIIDMNKYIDNINREKTPEQKQAWKEYFEKSAELEERRKRGMQLFAEYYFQLWD